VGTPLAVKLLNPDKPVLSVVGHGSFAVQVHVLSTTMQYRLPVVFLEKNNSVLDMVRDGQRGRIISSEFVQTDFAMIALSFGCHGVNVSKPNKLVPVIQEAMKAAKPTVIDAATSTEEPFFKMFSRQVTLTAW
jgi:acetolactate synthase-1/2/3 large subunit